MSAAAQLTEQEVARWVGPPSFERGRRYARNSAIFNARRQGELLKAQCRGSQLQPYRVEAELGARGVLAANCSCPKGWATSTRCCCAQG